MIRFLSSVLLAGVATGTLVSLARQRNLWRSGSSEGSRLAQQTWEGEGGALPETGSQLGPDPALSAPGVRTAGYGSSTGFSGAGTAMAGRSSGLAEETGIENQNRTTRESLP
jgi:hypothetical protein